MTAYTFETITSAQAGSYTAPPDTLTFTTPGANPWQANLVFDFTGAFLGSNHYVSVTLGARSVEFGFGIHGTQGVFSDGSILFIGCPYRNDWWVGSAGADAMYGVSGDDSLSGLGGDDHLLGGDGADTLLGGTGNDLLEGGDGADSLSGGADNDILIGGAGADTLDGGAGGVDVARFSGASTDYVISDLGGGVLQVSGPDGADRLVGIEKLAFDNGVFGQDVAPSGADSSSTLAAGASHTLVVSDFGFSDSQGDGLSGVRITTLPSSGHLTLNATAVTVGEVVSAHDIQAGLLVFTSGGVGTTAFTFQVRDDGLAGWGSNEDPTPNTLTFITPQPEPPPPAPPPPPPPSPPPPPPPSPSPTPPPPTDGGGASIITGGSSGTAGPDVVQLGASSDHFAAGDGNDTVDSGGGDDWVQGNAGDDSIVAGTGADTVLGGRGDDTVYGGQGDDVIYGDDGANYLRGGDGNDLIIGGQGFDYAHGNTGDDTVHGGLGDDWVLGGQGADQVFGDAGNDIVNGNLGSDTCSGGDGADSVRGGQGDDVVDGGAGADWLSGDLGNDTLIGGPGADTFHMSAGGGVDRVQDFNAAEGDRVELSAGQSYTLSQLGADTVIDLSGGDRMVLVGVPLTSLPDGWIFSA